MKLNEKNQALETFFASNAVKNIFDNIRNMVLSSAVLIAGNFLLTNIVPISDSPQFVTVFAKAFIGCGFLLMFLCTTHGYFLLKKSGISVFAARLIALMYFGLAGTFFVTLLRSKGITFG